MPPVERALIDDVERRLAKEYAAFSADYVAAVVQHVYARFDTSRVRGFIPLLVERRAAEELRSSRADLVPVGLGALRVASREFIAV